MPLGEADIKAKLIVPAIHRNGWTEDLIRREETAGTVEIIDCKARRRASGKMGFSLESPVAHPLLQPYSGGEGTRRYYQDAAIRSVMEKLLRRAINGEM